MKYIIGRGQAALIPAFLAGDSGDFFFAICQKLGEFEMGLQLEGGRPFLAKASLEFVQYLDEKDLQFIKKVGVQNFLENQKAEAGADEGS